LPYSQCQNLVHNLVILKKKMLYFVSVSVGEDGGGSIKLQ